MVSTTEVAKHAGVSQTTVSRVLNRPEQVRKETYDKVMQALAELNYGKVNQVELERSGTSREILIALSAGYSKEANLLEWTAEAQGRGYQVLVRPLTGEESEEDCKEFIKSAAGILGVGEIPGIFGQVREAASVPYVHVNDAMKKAPELDGKKAARLATEHLMEHGHKRIGWVGQDSPNALERLQGYYEAHGEQQLKIRKKRIHSPEKKAEYDAVATELKTFKNPTTAFVAATPEDGSRLLEALQNEGYRVPKDLSLIAIGEAETDGALTTVKAVPQQIEQSAMGQLLVQLEAQEGEPEVSAAEFQIDNRKTVKAKK